MPVFDIFSKRQKRSRGEVPDMYQYETIPQELRVQVVHILQDAWGNGQFVYLDEEENTTKHINYYETIHNTLCREYGVFVLDESFDFNEEMQSDYYEASVIDFLLKIAETEKAIDVIEFSFRFIDRYVRENAWEFNERKILPDDAIDELNYRFNEHGVGYQYESGFIVRVDSQLVHAEVVRPALVMLSDPMYKGANAEFLSAHEHYRKRRYKECLNDCLKAFESCIKAICEKRRWPYNDSDGASRLVSIVFERKLISNFLQSHFSALRNTLEAGVPTVRNRLSGHGQGSTEVPVPESIAGYALHLTASNILLLARADEEMN